MYICALTFLRLQAKMERRPLDVQKTFVKEKTAVAHNGSRRFPKPATKFAM